MRVGNETTMRDRELEFPEWQVPLQNLILEFDSEKLPQKVQAVESAILDRLQHIRHQSDRDREQQVLNDGLSTLRVIKSDRLGRQRRQPDNHERQAHLRPL
jgi:hypothetical protein